MKRPKLMNSVVKGVLFGQECDIKKVASGTDPDAREDVELNLGCTYPQEMNDQDRERAGLASKFTAFRVHTDVPVSATIRTHHRFVHLGVDYKIAKVIEHPKGSPEYLELLLQDDS